MVLLVANNWRYGFYSHNLLLLLIKLGLVLKLACSVTSIMSSTVLVSIGVSLVWVLMLSELCKHQFVQSHLHHNPGLHQDFPSFASALFQSPSGGGWT